MGIPSLQLEMPFSVRKYLANHPDKLAELGRAIQHVYNDVHPKMIDPIPFEYEMTEDEVMERKAKELAKRGKKKKKLI